MSENLTRVLRSFLLGISLASVINFLIDDPASFLLAVITISIVNVMYFLALSISK